MNKSLAPLIIFFALLILLTLVISNIQSRGKITEPDTADKNFPEMRLSPYKKGAADAGHQKSSKPGRAGAFGDVVKKLYREAVIFLDEGNEKDAEDRLRSALVFEPDNFNVLTLLGGIFYNTGRHKEAEMIFRRQITLRPDNAGLYNNLGSAMAKMGKMNEAIKASSHALTLSPGSTSALLNLAGMYSVSGDTASALDCLKKAYERSGPSIIPFAYDPTLDNIRHEPEFKSILYEAGRRRRVHLRNQPAPAETVSVPEKEKPESGAPAPAPQAAP